MMWDGLALIERDASLKVREAHWEAQQAHLAWLANSSRTEGAQRPSLRHSLSRMWRLVGPPADWFTEHATAALETARSWRTERTQPKEQCC